MPLGKEIICFEKKNKTSICQIGIKNKVLREKNFGSKETPWFTHEGDNDLVNFDSGEHQENVLYYQFFLLYPGKDNEHAFTVQIKKSPSLYAICIWKWGETSFWCPISPGHKKSIHVA